MGLGRCPVVQSLEQGWQVPFDECCLVQPQSWELLALDDALRAMRLAEKLEDLDDVQKVYSNLDITDEQAEQFANS